MFILDSLMIAGIRWALQTALTAAEAEMNDDTSLREQLLESEMRRELGEISDDEYRAIEADLLARMREIRERREGAGPLSMAAGPMEASPDTAFTVEADVSGDFHGGPAERSERQEGPAPSARPGRPQPAARPERASRSKRPSRSGGAARSIARARRVRTTKA